MKKLLFTAISALAVVGVAQAAESTEFGVLRVPSSATQTIVAVPWLASGTGNDSVKVADLVLTADLSVGDELKYYNGVKYECWGLQEVEGSKKWVASTTVSETGVGTDVASQDATISRGRAIILKRTGSDLSKGFCIMGKPAETSSGELELTSGGSGQAYSLIAPPKTTATTVGSLTWEGLAPYGDFLFVTTSAGRKTLTWTQDGWVYSNGTSASEVEIAVGEGVWFLSRSAPSGTSVKKVKWN